MSTTSNTTRALMSAVSSVAKGAWSNLKFYAGDATGAVLSNLALRIRKHKQQGNVDYVYQRAYKNVLVFAAKRYAIQKVESELKAILPRVKHQIANKQVQTARKQQKANYAQLIQNQQTVVENYGKIIVTSSNSGWNYIYAEDKNYKIVEEALILYYDQEEEYWYEQRELTTVDENGKEIKSAGTEGFKTYTVAHIDLAPEITMNSTKNVVLTQVTGRDYTRKELVSGGDLQFTVTGSIVSNQQGVYPKTKVQAFLQIMKYNGIVNVSSFFFGNLNVAQLIIKDFSLHKQEYMNIQPYSFTCVAVEPDEEIKMVKDTISEINYEISTSSSNKWYQYILQNKLAKITTNATIAATTSVVSLGLDDLLSFNDN